MASSINAITTGSGGVITTADNSGVLNLQTGGTTAVSVDATQNVTFTNGANLPNTFGFKNRIINGAMVIDQRKAGVATTGLTGGAYFADRWQTFQNYGTVTVQQSTTAPTGFINSFYTTVTTTGSVSASSIYAIAQSIEGLNCADLGYGTATASTVTVSFQVRSSVTGTYGVFIRNSAADRYYATTFSISSANTWTSVSLTIAGDTSGTWLTTNGIGLTLGVVLGAGSTRQGTANTWTGSANGPYTTSSQVDWMSNTGATFYITGVQLEKGSTATSFDMRDYGRELIMCQRYYSMYSKNGEGAIANCSSASAATAVFNYPIVMRTTPTVTLETAGKTTNTICFLTTSGNFPATVGSHAVTYASSYGFTLQASGYTAAGWAAGIATVTWRDGFGLVWNASAEL